MKKTKDDSDIEEIVKRVDKLVDIKDLNVFLNSISDRVRDRVNDIDKSIYK